MTLQTFTIRKLGAQSRLASHGNANTYVRRSFGSVPCTWTNDVWSISFYGTKCVCFLMFRLFGLWKNDSCGPWRCGRSHFANYYSKLIERSAVCILAMCSSQLEMCHTRTHVNRVLWCLAISIFCSLSVWARGRRIRPEHDFASIHNSQTRGTILTTRRKLSGTTLFLWLTWKCASYWGPMSLVSACALIEEQWNMSSQVKVN